MEVCKYHLSSHSEWRCNACKIDFCGLCVSYPDKTGRPECVLCKRSLFAKSKARLLPGLGQKIYDLAIAAASPVLVIVAFSFALLLSIFNGHGLASLIQLLILLPLFEVGFWLFERSSSNSWQQPSLQQIFTHKGYGQAFRLALFYYFVLLLNHELADKSSTLAILFSLFIGLMTPASIVTLAMEKSLLTMFDPRRLLFVLTTFGKDYRYLWLMFAFVTAGAIFLGQRTSEVNFIALSLAFMLLIWIFFIAMLSMGYLVSRYQVELNYAAGLEALANSAQELKAQQSALFDVDIFLQEGRFEDARARLLQLIKENRSRHEAYQRLIKLYLVQDNQTHAMRFWQEYLELMMEQHKSAQVAHFMAELDKSGYSLPVENIAYAAQIAEHWLNKKQWTLAVRLLGNEPVKPEPTQAWQQHSLLRLRIAVEFERNEKLATRLIDYLNKHSFDESVLKTVAGYEQVLSADS